MTDWLAARSARERLLLAGALVMFVLTLLFIGYGRIASLTTKMQLDVKRAAQTLDRLNATQPSAATISKTESRLSPDDLRRKILGTASGRGLEVTEVRMEPDKQISVQIGEAKSDLIFGWLVDLQAKSGVQIVSASMTEVGGGLVRSRFEFELAVSP